MKSGPILRLATEFVVIVLGVLTALAADQWVSGRSDRTLEQEYVERLLDDVRADRRENSFIREVLADGDAASRQLLDLIEAERVGDTKAVSLNRLVLTAARRRRPDYARATYRELVNSGRVGLVRAADVRAALAVYERTVLEYDGFWGYWSGFNDDFVSLALRRIHPDVSRAFWGCREMWVNGEGTAAPKRDPEECIPEGVEGVSASLRSFLRDPETVPLLYEQMRFQDDGQRVVEALDEAAAVLEAVLEEGYGAPGR